VSDLGQRGRRVADYLADRGPEGLLSEVTEFARRRPMAFLASAVAAGFLVGRMGKGIWKAQSENGGSTTSTVDAVPARADERMERVTTTAPQWTEPPSTVTGVAPAPASPVAPATPAAAPVTPAVPGMPATEPVPPTPYAPSPYASETYDETYRRSGGEPR
jgi:hypothetical protein